MADTNYLIAAKAKELLKKSEYAPSSGKFLTPAEQIEFHKAVKSIDSHAMEKLFFWGGCKGAERRIPVFLPEYMLSGHGSAENFERDPYSSEREDSFLSATDGWDRQEICSYDAIVASGGGFVSLTHRDYLGSLLALGVERDVIGDIAPRSESSAVIFLLRPMGAFAEENFTHVGRDRATVYRTSLNEDFTITRKYEEIVLICASTRLDGIVKAFASVGREEAQRLIASGYVSVNYRDETRVDFRLDPDGKSVVSVRGYGKMRITGAAGETRSGRMRITAQKYI